MGQDTKRISERWNYDVFLSFRGTDVRKNFLSNLYNGFKRCGISTFMDDVELERGEYISKQLLKAIETSKILIVILSKDYASSSWCLDELVHIMKSHNFNHSKLVFPIFFYVDPSDIRRQKGSFAQAFSKHKTRYPVNKVNDWREALTKVANLSGWDIRHWNEAECIEDITREILKRLPCQYLHVHPYVVGMKSRLQRISSLLSIGSDEVRVIGIYGMSGIGKTTLAKVVFNEFSHLFEGSSFLENFREYSKKLEGRTHLQHQLLTDILKRNDIGFNGLDHAVKERFRNKRLLIVVDDVDDIHQINSAGIDPSCFGDGSRIIITTTNMHLLKQLQVKERYSLEELDGDESLELFSWHAFRTSEPPHEEFLQLSKKVVAYCAGLPLAVEVLGAFLVERNIQEWESTLKLLKQIPNQNIQAKLRISFDALDSVHKDVFLDIACFFIGMDRDYVACILDGCNLNPDIVLSVLTEKCLITVCRNNIMMHDLLRDMGRQIVREISSKKRGEHSRLWNPDDVISVLSKKSGTSAVEGVSFKARVTDNWSFEVEAFTEMQELRLLQLSYVNLNGSYEHFPEDLRWLSWHGFSSEFFPTSLSLRSLVVLDLQWSNLKRFWNDQEHPQQANMLKYLDLSHSIYLRETPDFSYLPNIEKLLLVNCKSLVLVHKSIGILCKKLVLLNLSSCIELDSLPEEFYKLKSLETLHLSYCSKFERFDNALGDLDSLTTLNADFTALKEIPSSINQLKKLENLSLNGCKGLLSVDRVNPYSENNPSSASMLLPVSLSGLSCLTTLSLAYCNLSDDLIPKDIGSLSFLHDLDLGGNDFRNLQVDFASLPNLSLLRLSNCSKLQSILSLPRSLSKFYAEDCILLERTPNLTECPNLNQLHLDRCISLVEIPGVHDTKCGILITMTNCNLKSNTTKKLLQDWIKKNNNCIYLPGYDIPNWIRFKAEMSSFSFTVPETHNSVPAAGFTLWTRFLAPFVGDYTRPCPITVKNLTKDSSWIHGTKENPRDSSDIITNDFRIETGDQIEVYAVCDDDVVTILEIGFALSYNSRDSIDFSSRDHILCGDHRMTWACFRSQRKTFVRVIRLRSNLMNGIVPRLYTCSIFPQTSRHQESKQSVVEESHHQSRRKMGMGIKKLLFAIIVLILAIVLGKYGKTLVPNPS